jgi:type II secretory pathway pseudopilin PulG
MKKFRRDAGFTVIELVVIIIILCILGTLVALTYRGVQANNRNNERQTDIDIIQSQLETYYAIYNKYPGPQQINDASWRAANLKKVTDDVIKDPQWSKEGACSKDGKPLMAFTVTDDCYSYVVAAPDGGGCDSDVVAPCGHYALTAVLESGEKYVKTSLN